MVIYLYYLLAFFVRFSLSTSSITLNTIKDTSFHTEWQCKTRDRHVYIATSQGTLHFINIFTGKIDYSLDTGGSIFNSSGHDAYTFLPTIGNYFLANTDPNKKSLSKNNGEIVISSVQSKSTFIVDEKNGIIGCTQTENTFTNQQNQEKSGIVPINSARVERTDNSLLFNSDLPPGSTKVERTDYSIVLNGEHSKILSYSYFSITTSKTMQTLYPQEVRLLTSSDGNVKLIVNNSIKTSQKIIGVPVVVFGTDGLLRFSPHLSDLQILSFMSSLPPLTSTVKTDEPPQTKIETKIKKHDFLQTDQIIFVQKEENTFSTPTANFEKNGHLPQKMSITSSKVNDKIIQQNFIKRTESTESEGMKFTFNAEIDLNKGKSQSFFTTRNKKRNENVNFAINYNSNNNRSLIALPIVTLFAFAVAIIAIYIHIENEKKNQITIFDPTCFTSTSEFNQKCLRSVDYTLIKNIESIAEINDKKNLFAFPLKIEPHQSESGRDDNYNSFYLVTHQPSNSFRFDLKFDVIDFLRRMLTAIDLMHRNGIVHSSISEEAFFISQTENGGKSLLGLIEEKSHYAESKDEFDEDILALKSVIQRHLSNGCTTVYSTVTNSSSLKIDSDESNYNENQARLTSSMPQNEEILSSLSNDQILIDFLSNNDFLNTSPTIFGFKSTASYLLSCHPIFMTSLERLHLLEDAYTFLSSSSGCILKDFESQKFEIFGRTWARSVPKSFLVEASSQRRYNTSSLRDLVALIRNKWVHKVSLNQNRKNSRNNKIKKSEIGISIVENNCDNDNGNDPCDDLGIKKVYGNGSPECYFEFFNSKFPKLFIYVYNFCRVQKSKL